MVEFSTWSHFRKSLRFYLKPHKTHTSEGTKHVLQHLRVLHLWATRHQVWVGRWEKVLTRQLRLWLPDDRELVLGWLPTKALPLWLWPWGWSLVCVSVSHPLRYTIWKWSFLSVTKTAFTHGHLLYHHFWKRSSVTDSLYLIIGANFWESVQAEPCWPTILKRLSHAAPQGNLNK